MFCQCITQMPYDAGYCCGTTMRPAAACIAFTTAHTCSDVGLGLLAPPHIKVFPLWNNECITDGDLPSSRWDKLCGSFCIIIQGQTELRASFCWDAFFSYSVSSVSFRLSMTALPSKFFAHKSLSQALSLKHPT